MASEEGELTPSRLHNPYHQPGQKEIDPDDVEETMHRKSWVLSVLTNLMQEVERHADLEESEEGVDVSESQQNELSQLWDMTLSSEFRQFLMTLDSEHNTWEMLICAVFKSRAPRINEICIGMLGNVCTEPDLCVTLSQKEDFIKLICAVLSNIEFDAPTLREAIRLVLTCLGQVNVEDLWLRALMETPHLFSLIGFVLESAREVELLTLTGTLLDTLMGKEEELCETWATTQLVDSMLAAMKQIGFREKENVKPFLSIFQLLSTTQAGVQCLVERCEEVVGVLLQWLWKVCDDDILVLTDHMPYHTCVVSLINLLFTNVPSAAAHLLAKTSLMKDMLKTLGSLYNINLSHDNPAALPRCIFFTPRVESPATAASQGSAQPTEAVTGPQTATDQDSSRKDGAVTKTASDDRKMSVGDGGGDLTSEARKRSEQQTVGESEEREGQGKDREAENGREGGLEEEIRRAEERREREFFEEREKKEQEREVTRRIDCQRYKALLESLQEYFRSFFSHMKLENQPEEGSRERGRRRLSNSVPFYNVLRHLGKCPRRTISYLVSVLVYNVPDSIDASVESCGQDALSAEGLQVVRHLHQLFQKLHFTEAAEKVDDVLNTVKLTAGISP